MDLKFLQANVNHCARAQDLLSQSLAQWSVQVAVVAEPYFIPPRDNWAGDLDGLVAIITQGAAGSPPFGKIVKGRGCVAALLGDIWVVGVYFSPNRPLAEFEVFLTQLGALMVQGQPHPAIVAGDFNAKSIAWGSPATDVRGEVLEDWAISVGLVILNRGSVDTCVRHNGGSIVDISFASPAVARRVRGWRVLVGAETLSDHRYIRFDVSASSRIRPGRGSSAPVQGGPRWVLRRLDKEALEVAALMVSWLPVPDGPVRVEEEAESLGVVMTDVCDAAMPRALCQSPRRQVYWWSADLAQLRIDCVNARRQFSRHRRRRLRGDDFEEQERLLHGLYKEAKRALQVAIHRAKVAARREFVGTLDRDPWGRPYRLVMNKLRPAAPPLSQSLQPGLLADVVAALFPATEGFTPPPMAPPDVASSSVNSSARDDIPEVSPEELRAAVLRLRSKNTAPGLDGIPGKAWVLALEHLGPRLRSLFSACLAQGVFPDRWKTGKLVLLQKAGRPAESPSAYRPIVLLDEVAKLFERILHARLVEHLERVGPDLADEQFGFRRGRSTVHAILRVKAQAEDAVASKKVVIAVSLDISNAFNALPWPCINEALRYHVVPPYLRRLVHSYLSNRYVVYPGADGWHRRAMSCGVPQGSVLGPLLWNIGYDWVLRGTNLLGVGVTCYADDTLVTATSGSFQDAAILAAVGTGHVVSRIRRLGLKVALDKTEAVCFHGPRKGPPAGAHITVDGVRIPIGKTMKYLGLVLDSRWEFRAHFTQLRTKLSRAAGALSSLLPNLEGPGIPCRSLYHGVVRSMALYGSPVWAHSLSDRCVALLRNPQRVVAQRAIRAYRTVSYEAACVLAGFLPWDLDARALSAAFHWREEASRRGQRPAPSEVEAARASLRRAVVEEWRHRLEAPSAGLRVVAAVRPVFAYWLDRRHGAATFRLTQILTGHGCFGEYLCRIVGTEESAVCHHCDNCPLDTAQHTLEECPAWDEERSALRAVVGGDLSLPAVVSSMVESRRSWRAVAHFCEVVLSQKESAERDREREDPSRRQRRRRRRRVDD